MATHLDENFTEDDPDLILEEGDDGDDAHEPGEGDGGDDPPPATETGDDDEDVVTFGGEAARAEDDPPAIRNMREQIRKLERENRELKGGPRRAPVPEKPTLEACDFDEEEFERRYADYLTAKREQEDQEREREAAARRAQTRWEEQSRRFEDGWTGLRIVGKDAARAKVEMEFDETQLVLLKKAARGNGAGLFYALGSNPERLKALAELKNDPAEFIAEAAVLAKEVQVTKRKPTTTPERVHGGTHGGGAGRVDGKLARLNAEAAETGDYSKVVAHMTRTEKR